MLYTVQWCTPHLYMNWKKDEYRKYRKATKAMVDTCFSFWLLCEPACSVQYVNASLLIPPILFPIYLPSHLPY